MGVLAKFRPETTTWRGVYVSRRGQCDSCLFRRDEHPVTLPHDYMSDRGNSAQGRNPAAFQRALCEPLGAIPDVAHFVRTGLHVSDRGLVYVSSRGCVLIMTR